MGWYRALVTEHATWLLRAGRSPATVKTWATPLRDFGRYVDGLQPSELGRSQIEAWQDEVRRRYPNPHTQLVYATALRALLRYAELEREELELCRGLVWRVVVPKQPEGQPRPLEPEDLRRILAHLARPSKDLIRMRDRALFLVLLTTGARISEALQMTVDHISGGPIVVRQKGGGDKRLVLGETAREWARQYLRLRGPDEQPALWIRVGRGNKREPLSGEAVNLRWNALAEQLRLPHWSSHQLRHTAGTELLESGAQDIEVAEVLGHANLNMVRRYARVSETRRRELVSRLDRLATSPRPAILKPLKRRRRKKSA